MNRETAKTRLSEAAAKTPWQGCRALLVLAISTLDGMPYGTTWAHHAKQEQDAADRWNKVCAGIGAWGGQLARERAEAGVKHLADTHALLANLYRSVGEYEASHAPETIRAT